MFAKTESPIQLNNRAVQLMEDGDLSSANQLLKTALRIVAMPQNKKETVVCATNASFSWSGAATIVHNKASEEAESHGTFLFSRTILIKSGVASRECKAAMVFNAGLVAHMLATITPSPQSAMLRKAKTLYSLSRSILKRFRTSVLFHKLFIHMAILNNIGHLSYELADFACCRCCFDHLRLAIVSHRKFCGGVYDELEQRGMVGNAMFETPTTAPCA